MTTGSRIFFREFGSHWGFKEVAAIHQVHFEKHDGSCQDPSTLENLVPPWKTSSHLLKIWSTQSNHRFSPCKALCGEADCLAPHVSLPELSLQSWSKKVISRLTDKECENATGNDWHMLQWRHQARWALITDWPGGSTCQMTHFHRIPRGFSSSLSPCTSLRWALSSDAGSLASLQALRHWVTCHQAGTWQKSTSWSTWHRCHAAIPLRWWKSPCWVTTEETTGTHEGQGWRGEGACNLYQSN